MPPDEEHLSLRQADQIRGDPYALQDELDFIKVQLARLPTRNEVWQTIEAAKDKDRWERRACAQR